MASMTEPRALAALRSDDPALVARAEAWLWRTWCHAGVEAIDELMRRGVAAMERGELGPAETLFAEMIGRAPDFAEGWNKRATVRYLREDYAGSIDDCREVLGRKPHHFGALAGQGLCHMARGEFDEAAELFRRALEVHPRLAAVRRNLRAAISEMVRYN